MYLPAAAAVLRYVLWAKVCPGQTDGRKSSSLPSQTSCRVQTGMDDCVAAVTAAVAAYRRCKQIMRYINELALVLGV